MEGLSKPSQAVIRAPVTAAEGMVFVGTGRAGMWGYLHGFDARTGELLWKRAACPNENYRHHGGNESAPVLFNKVLYWANPSEQIEALDPRTGERIPGWPVKPVDEESQYKVRLGAQLMVNAEGTAVVSATARKRTRYWRVSLMDHTLPAGEVAGSTRVPHRAAGVITSDRACFVMLNARGPACPSVYCSSVIKGRSRIFHFEDPEGGGPFTRSLVLANRVLFGVTCDGRIYALDAYPAKRRTEVLWTQELKTPVQGTPAVASGHLFIGAEDGCMRAFAAASEAAEGGPDKGE
jgi:outer membrane protein assembly factor BamB